MASTLELLRSRPATIVAIGALLLAAGCSSAPPLSGARVAPATAAAPAAVPAPVPAPAPSTTTAAAPAAPAVTPSALSPPPPASAASTAIPALPVVRLSPTATVAPAVHNDLIALVLPLESPTYGRAADAVKAGFLAAAARAGSSSRIRVIGHGDDGVLLAVAAANNAEVGLVVGPLTRDDLRTVLSMAPSRPRVLALNQLDDGAPLPHDTYTMALSVDSDASLLARTARADGVRTVALVAADSPLQQRFVAAFEAEWQRGGGTPPRAYHFDPNPDMLALLRREIAARPTDAIVLAVDGDHAALTKSFLPPVPVYSISQIADELPTPISHDLDGIRYVEIPWLADPDDPAIANLPHANYDNPVVERLYALGLDAFALAQMLAEPVPPSSVELDGATGHLSLTPAHSFARQGRLMEIRDGHAGPVSAKQ